MNLEKFDNLDKEKKERIIDAAINEFIKEGFNGASTNTIVKNAEISKGALFNYFENKENLFLYIFNHTIQKIGQNFQNQKKALENVELFEGLKFFINANISFFTKHPKEFQFLAKSMTDSPENIRISLFKIKREFQGDIIKYLISNTNEEYFRTGIKKEHVEYFLLTLLDTLSNKYIEKYKGNITLLVNRREERENEIIDYVDLLKYGIWNREEK